MQNVGLVLVIILILDPKEFIPREVPTNIWNALENVSNSSHGVGGILVGSAGARGVLHAFCLPVSNIVSTLAFSALKVHVD